jgi:hypothetical protein
MDLDNLDILHVMDPAFSWYCQDPTYQLKGGQFFFKEKMKKLIGMGLLCSWATPWVQQQHFDSLSWPIES